MRLKILIVIGTRPEAIKMAPLIKLMSLSRLLQVRVCVTAQHRQMLDQVLDLFDIRPDYDLDLMREAQTLTLLTGRILEGLERVLLDFKPHWLVVHGDTSTTFASSLAAYYQHVRIAHVEAGLRTHDLSAPWPEEANRQLTGRLASLHFAPTKKAAKNLLNEGISRATIHVTGNTVIDALFNACALIDQSPAVRESLRNMFSFLDENKKLILITGHRRENFGTRIEEMCYAINDLAARPDVEIVYPVHLNPRVQEPVRRLIGQTANVKLLEPLDYIPFIHLMRRSYIILTDSGGVQEEAPSLGKPVLVMRDATERPEAIEAGTVLLVGTNRERIVQGCLRLLDTPDAYQKMSCAHNPYGDGKSSNRILTVFEELANSISDPARAV